MDKTYAKERAQLAPASGTYPPEVRCGGSGTTPEKKGGGSGTTPEKQGRAWNRQYIGQNRSGARLRRRKRQIFSSATSRPLPSTDVSCA